MGLLLHAAALAVAASFVWAALTLAARRVPRAGQIEYALWLLRSERAAPWWKNQPMLTAALAETGRSRLVRVSAAAATALGAVAASAALWAAVSWLEFRAWLDLLRDSPVANLGLVAIPMVFVVGGVYLAALKCDRIASAMARVSDPRRAVVWAAIDVTSSVVLGLLGWIGFLAALVATGREQELAHVWTRAVVEMEAGWSTGLALAADRRGWPSWGVWYYAVTFAALLPWLHGLAAWTLRLGVRYARPVVERIDTLGIINLENRPLAAIAAVAAMMAAGGYSLVALVG